MIKTNTRNLAVGAVVVIDGEARIITAMTKAWKAPEWYITYIQGNNSITRNFNSNKKWDVLDLVKP
mgnify:CR=1 FL=1